MVYYKINKLGEGYEASFCKTCLYRQIIKEQGYKDYRDPKSSNVSMYTYAFFIGLNEINIQSHNCGELSDCVVVAVRHAIIHPFQTQEVEQSC